MEAQEYEQAIEICMNFYRRTNNPDFGLPAAQAHLALGHYGQALELAKELEATARKAEAEMVEGRVYAAQAVKPDTPPESQSKLLAEALQWFGRAAESFRESGDMDGQSGAAYAKSWVHHQNYEYGLALEASAQALDLARSRENRFKALQGSFNYLMAIGDLDRAETVLEKVFEEMPDPGSNADPVVQARLLNYQAQLHMLKNRPELAALAAAEAIRMYQLILTERKPSGYDYTFMRSTLLNQVQADLDHSRQKRDAARTHLEQALQYKSDARLGTLLLRQAEIQHENHNHGEAIETLSQALKLELDAELAWQVFYLLGRSAEAVRKSIEAEASFRSAVENIDKLQDQLKQEELKSWLLEERRQPYEALFNLLAKSGRAREALETAERIQARTFLDAFIKSTSSLPPAQGPASDVARAAADRFESLNSLLPAMRGSEALQPLPPEKTLEAVRRRFFLAYFQAGDQLWLIYQRDGEPVAIDLGSAARIDRLVDDYLADRDDEGENRLATLGKILLPEGSLPPPGETLYIVADRELRNLPFAALRPSGRHLVEDYALVYPPSLSALARMETAELPVPGGDPVVIGDPLGDLNEALAEAQEAARLLGVEPALGEEAKQERLWKAANARILHLSTHTGLDESGPWLRLTDGRVTAKDVIDKGMAPGLTVLATCASGARRGTQFWGSLGAAFLASGSRSVLATLWSVEDREAKDFIVRFYRRGGASPASALAEAQRELIAADAKVSAWAPYVLFGSDPHWGGAAEETGRQ